MTASTTIRRKPVPKKSITRKPVATQSVATPSIVTSPVVHPPVVPIALQELSPTAVDAACSSCRISRNPDHRCQLDLCSGSDERAGPCSLLPSQELVEATIEVSSAQCDGIAGLGCKSPDLNANGRTPCPAESIKPNIHRIDSLLSPHNTGGNEQAAPPPYAQVARTQPETKQQEMSNQEDQAREPASNPPDYRPPLPARPACRNTPVANLPAAAPLPPSTVVANIAQIPAARGPVKQRKTSKLRLLNVGLQVVDLGITIGSSLVGQPVNSNFAAAGALFTGAVSQPAVTPDVWDPVQSAASDPVQ